MNKEKEIVLYTVKCENDTGSKWQYSFKKEEEARSYLNYQLTKQGVKASLIKEEDWRP